MKKLLLLLPFIFSVIFSFGQNGLGVDVGFATSKAAMVAGKYFVGPNGFSLGGSYQSNHELGKRLTQKNDSIIGNGNYFYTLDLGYTRVLNDQFSVEGELSIGPKKYYNNYRDKALSAGAYHVISKTKTTVGAGAFVIYHFNEIFGIYAGYNSIREGSFGLQIRFGQKK